MKVLNKARLKVKWIPALNLATLLVLQRSNPQDTYIDLSDELDGLLVRKLAVKVEECSNTFAIQGRYRCIDDRHVHAIRHGELAPI